MNSKIAKTQRQKPLYQKIKDYIIDKINEGDWQVDSKISSEAELGALFNASRMTVNRALRELTAEGRLLRKQGNGTFVTSLKPQSALIEITSIAEEIQQSGARYSCDVHLLCKEKATPEMAEKMEFQPYSTLYHSIIVHRKDGIPIQLAERFINPTIAPDYLSQDFTRITASEYLLKLAPVSKIEHIVEALIPAAWARDLLEINAYEPCLALKRKTWTKGIVATHSCFYYPGSRHSLGGTFAPLNSGSIQVV